MNSILALMEMESPDRFAEDVANAYFQNPVHVRKILNENCIESCVDYVLGNQQVEFDLSDLDLFNEEEVLFSKPSRQRGKRKHNKKEVRRKGNAKRFRDRSRKWQSEEHECSVYSRNLCGDGNRRGRRLAKTGEVAFKSNRQIIRDIEVDPKTLKEEETETRSFTYLDSGFTLSMSMSKSAWEKEEKDDFSPSFNWDRKYTVGWDDDDENWLDDKDWLDWEDEWENDDDEIIDEPESKKQYHTSEFTVTYDTSEFTAIDMAWMNMKLACANPDQRAWIREFMKTL